jgi:hypothetical protein
MRSRPKTFGKVYSVTGEEIGTAEVGPSAHAVVITREEMPKPRRVRLFVGQPQPGWVVLPDQEEEKFTYKVGVRYYVGKKPRGRPPIRVVSAPSLHSPLLTLAIPTFDEEDARHDEDDQDSPLTELTDEQSSRLPTPPDNDVHEPAPSVAIPGEHLGIAAEVFGWVVKKSLHVVQTESPDATTPPQEVSSSMEA